MTSIVFHPRGVHNQRFKKMTKSSNLVVQYCKTQQNTGNMFLGDCGSLRSSCQDAYGTARCLASMLVMDQSHPAALKHLPRSRSQFTL